MNTPGTVKLLQLTGGNLDGTYGDPAIVVDGDAEAARQLHHAITVTRAGATVDWEETLKVLGIDVSQEPESVSLQEQCKQWDREWTEMLMDSTKRKRRKKMKKHK